MASEDKAAKAAKAADERRVQYDLDRLERRGLRRGVLSTQPLEDVTIGTDCIFGWLDLDRPFYPLAVALQASDAAAGSVEVGLYRARLDDIKAGTWAARRMASLTQALTATMTEYALQLAALGAARRAIWNPADDAFLVAVRGSTATVTVRGTDGYTPPAFGGRLMVATELPYEVTADGTTRTNKVPAIAVLSSTGVRVR